MYHLASCTTCQAIIRETKVVKAGTELQNIKEEKITPQQLEEMKNLAGSYEALFSRRALKYKELGLKDKQLTEDDYKNFILKEYTFLKRPVTIFNGKIFIGNDKKTVGEIVRPVKCLSFFIIRCCLRFIIRPKR